LEENEKNCGEINLELNKIIYEQLLKETNILSKKLEESRKNDEYLNSSEFGGNNEYAPIGENIEELEDLRSNKPQILFDYLKKILTKKEYHIIYRRFFENCSLQEIANDFDISREMVRLLQDNVLQKLKKIFKNST
jgi:RNA polymerase sigma factor (sigma-70 family)